MPATHADLAYFAKRRWDDEQSSAVWQYLVETAPGGAWIAKDSGDAIGIAITHLLEDECFVSELFVEPSFQRAGIGLRLLSEVARDSGDLARSGLLPATQVGALAFFARQGVPLQTPVITLRGEIPREGELLRMASGDYRFRTEVIDLHAHRQLLNALDREIRGSARPLDHDYFSMRGNGVAFYVRDEFVAYAYVWPNGRIGPMCVYSAAYLTQIFSFALVALRKVYDARWCTTLVPGNNIRIMRAGMRAGLIIEDTHIFASDAAALDLSRYIGFHPLLF